MRKKLFPFQHFFLIAMLMLCWNNVEAVPAKPDLTTFRQPVGELTVDILLKGDERVHWAETPDGYSLVFDDRRCLVYAMRNANGERSIIVSAHSTHSSSRRSSGTTLFTKPMRSASAALY